MCWERMQESSEILQPVGKVHLPNLLVLLCSREQRSVSPLGIADMPGFLAQKAAASAIIRYSWGTGENYLPWIQKGTEKAANEYAWFFLDVVSIFLNDYYSSRCQAY